GGDGAVAFRREKFIPFGGPAGGDGGRGGGGIFLGGEGVFPLPHFTPRPPPPAQPGRRGRGPGRPRRAAAAPGPRRPLGTQIRDVATGEILADVTAHEQRAVVARGGKGGRGNLHFATPTDRAPRRAEKGDAGEARELELTLKVMADVGLIGFPNVGKS